MRRSTVIFLVLLAAVASVIILTKGHIFGPGKVGLEQSRQMAFNSSPKTGMKIESPVFDDNGSIPSQYTCDGSNVNPSLAFSDIPSNAQSLALIVDDPDAPAGTWVHWTLWNIPPDVKDIAEDKIPAGAVEGITSFGSKGYGGPCPPSGTHRYFFKLYALDTKLDLPEGSRISDLENAVERHMIEQAELVGLYERR